MSDGHRSGRSTGRVSCRSTELKRCSVIEMRWNKYEVSLAYRIIILLLIITIIYYYSVSVAEWLVCWTQAQKGPGSNPSRDAVG